MNLYISLFLFLFGITFGSFFNVVGLRLPQKIPFTHDRSRCSTCDHILVWQELIPVLSFLIQGGKCRQCNTKISFIYPLTEVWTGILFVLSYLFLGVSFELLVALLLHSMLMIVFVSDFTYMVISNKVLLFFLPLFILLRMLSPLEPWYDSIIGAVIGFGLIALIIILSNGGMGAGDMKLFGVLGIVLGWKSTLLTFFLAAFLGAIIGGILMMMKKVERKQPIPFGPYIVVATILTYFYGEKLIDFYVTFF